MAIIQVVGEQMDKLIVQGLQDNFLFVNDKKLEKAIKRVLKYYMTHSDFEAWWEEVK